MNEYIETLKLKIKTDQRSIKSIPNWGIKEFKEYYLSQVPEIVKKRSSQRSEEEVERILYEEITNKLVMDIEEQGAGVREALLHEIQKLELFISRYSICCREYGKEIEITSEEDIIVEEIRDMYTMIRVPKVKLSLLCDRTNNNIVFKKSLLGNWYSCNLFVDETGFYEITPSEVNFYPSVKASPIIVSSFDSQSENYIGFLGKNTFVPHSKKSKCLFNEPSRKIMIDDYDFYRLNNPLKDLFGTLPNTATIFKTIELKESQATLAYLINIDDATIQSDIVDTLSGKRYEVDRTIGQKDAINKVYETVLSDLKQNYHNRTKKHTYIG